jgi:2-dehydro-3-deoxy-D-gluconate 5-dehydrogenase
MPLDKRVPPLTELLNLKNKRAIVTGAASGIGFAAAFRLAEAGARVAILDIDAEKGQTAAANLKSNGMEVFFIQADISREELLVKAIESATAQLGGVDILVNNAGIFPSTPLASITGTEIDRILGVNLKGLLILCRECAGRMIAQKSGGVIVNIASVDALHPIRSNMAVYDASKGAVLSLTRSLAKELAAENIRVNAVAPGGIFTEGAAADRTTGRAGLRETLARIPMGQMGKADDVARVILFLSCELSAYMTGSLVTVDGGFMVG